MAYGFNDNTYITLQRLEYYDIFSRKIISMGVGSEIGSAVANMIITKGDDDFKPLNGQAYIDMAVTKGLIELKV